MLYGRPQPYVVSGRDQGQAVSGVQGHLVYATKSGIEPALLCCWNYGKSAVKPWVDETSTSRSRPEMHRLSFRTSVPARKLLTWRMFSRAIGMWGTGAALELHQSIISDISDSLGAGLTDDRSPRVTRLGGLGLPRFFSSHLESWTSSQSFYKAARNGTR